MGKVLTLLSVFVLIAGIAYSGSDSKYKGRPSEEVLPETAVVEIRSVTDKVPPPDWSTISPAGVGTFTTLTGFYDYQINWGAARHVQVNPATGNVHVTYMVSDDSTAAGLNSMRGVAYAYSSDGGATWENFGNIRVPQRRAGFPSIDLGQGPIAGAALIANHTDPSVATAMHVDFPEGTGAFAELGPLPALGGSDDPIWPSVGGASDGSIVVAASRNSADTDHYTRTADFVTWAPWTQFQGFTNQSGGTYPVVVNGTGRVGILMNTSNGSAIAGNHWLESTDNGATWPATATTIYPLTREAPPDTFISYVHCDVVYDGDNALMVMDEYNAATGLQPNIIFWSAATGFVLAAPWDSTLYINDLNATQNNQRFHALSIGWPVIGMSGSRIAVAYQVFQPDTDALGYNISDIWFIESGVGGLTWTTPQNLTNTPNVDERYPSMSKWNAPGEANMTWQEKTAGHSGLAAFPGSADTVRTFQVFFRQTLTDVREEGVFAKSFKLNQNYPNPFNPSTKITYSIPTGADVKLSVYNVLGQEVAILVNGHRDAGTYVADFSADKLSSGVYFYTIKAGQFAETKKMLLLR